MVVVDIEDESRFPEYQSHPHTQKLIGKIEDSVEKKATFNHY